MANWEKLNKELDSVINKLDESTISDWRSKREKKEMKTPNEFYSCLA